MTSPVHIPLSNVSHQSLSTNLTGVQYTLELSTRGSRLYFTLSSDGTVVIANLLCQDRVWLIRKACYGASGDFAFIDMLGTQDPIYTGLDERYIFVYLAGKNAV